MKRLLKLLVGLPLGLAIATGIGQASASAADHLNLEEGLPVEVEDAYPIPYKGREVQGVFRYERTGDGEDRFVIEPRVEYGFAPNWQGRISVPVEVGSDQDAGIGDIGVEVFYNFNAEGLTTPAFAASVSADLPTGPDSAGVDPTLKLIATKTIGNAVKLDRLHLNLAYRLNTEPQANERSDSLGATLGYSRRLSPETMLVTDVVYEQEKEQDTDAVLLEAGVRYQLTPLSVLAIGAGAGLTEDSPDFRVTAGFQRSF